MKRSSSRILTTHVGSLPEPESLDPHAANHETQLRGAVADVIAQQRKAGLDIVNEGEFTKGGGWVDYAVSRLAGYEDRPDGGGRLFFKGKDREEFREFYDDATLRGTLSHRPINATPLSRVSLICTGPIVYRGMDDLKREIALLQAAGGDDEELFLTSVAPASFEADQPNAFYPSDEAYLFALADAMRVEYESIASSGVLLQVDDAWLPALWDRIGIAMGLEAFRKYCELRIEALNYALRNVPEDRVRYHLCWGSWHGPHAHDLEMIHLADLMLKVKAQAYLFEAANARHEHEYEVWGTVKLPAGKILVPGCITHSTAVVEHPELVSQRIQRFAHLVGKENVIAGADCGFGGRSHPQIAWAKLGALAEGAKRASQALRHA